MQKAKAVFILITFFLVACESQVKRIDMPEVESKLVVQCFISPEAPLTEAKVSWSSPIFNSSTNVQQEPNADVRISDGTISYLLVYDVGRGSYLIDSTLFTVIPGQQYFLTVKAPNGKQVTAMCRVPSISDTMLLSSAFDSTVTPQGSKTEVTYVLDLKIRDIANNRNYYRASAAINFENLTTGSFISYDFKFINNNGFINDEEHNGEIMEFGRAEVTRSYTGKNNLKGRYIDIYLVDCDENYYKYHYTLSNFDSDNPFAEPVFIHNNINGGLGCFGAYRRSYSRILF